MVLPLQQQVLQPPRHRTGLPMQQISPTDSLLMEDSTHTTHDEVLLPLRLHLVQTLILSPLTLVNTSTLLPQTLLSLLQQHQLKQQATTLNVSV